MYFKKNVDRTISDDSQEQDSNHSTSFEEQDSADHSHQLPRVPEKSPSTRLVTIATDNISLINLYLEFPY